MFGSSARTLGSASAALVTALSIGFVASEAAARSVIKQPGNHPDYSVELEPHLNLQWGQEPFGDLGLGVGMHATINIIEQGPIKTINNSMGLGFGLDWAHFGDDDGFCYWGRGYWDRRGRLIAGTGWDCSGDQLWFPVVWQWNFWLTDIISVYGEPGLAIQYESVTVPCATDLDGECTFDDIDLEFVFWAGGRFMFGETVGLNVKLGWPAIQIGASFLL